MTFDPAEYCAAITTAARDQGIKISGAYARPGGVDRKLAWREIAAAQARTEAAQSEVVLRALAAAFRVPAPAAGADDRSVVAWAEHFGRNVGQLSVLSQRAAAKGFVDASLDDLPSEYLHEVYAYLAGEYVGIVRRLGGEPSFLKRLSVPMVTTATVDRILAEPRFRDLGLAAVRAAVAHNPRNPNAYLCDVVGNIEVLMADPGLAWLGRSRASVVKHAVLRRRHDPEVFLEEVRTRFEELRCTFAGVGLSDSVLLHAVVNYSRRPEQYLTSVLETLHALGSDPMYRDVPPGVRRLAAQRYPKSAQRYLDRYLRLTEELKGSPYAELGAVALRTATTIYSTDPYPYLNQVRVRLAELNADPVAQGLPGWERERIAANYDDPVGFVHQMATWADQLEARMPTVSPVQLLRFCAYYPVRAGELVAGAPVEPGDVDRAHDRKRVRREAAGR